MSTGRWMANGSGRKVTNTKKVPYRSTFDISLGTTMLLTEPVLILILIIIIIIVNMSTGGYFKPKVPRLLLPHVFVLEFVFPCQFLLRPSLSPTNQHRTEVVCMWFYLRAKKQITTDTLLLDRPRRWIVVGGDSKLVKIKRSSSSGPRLDGIWCPVLFL